MNGIIKLPLVPLRSKDSERSEMTSQLLYGERVEILETRERWLFVRNIADNYTGWVDRKMVQILNLDHENIEETVDLYCVSFPIVECLNPEDNETLFLPGGSKLNILDGNKVQFGGKNYFIDPINLPYSNEKTGEQLVYLAKQYLNAPYLWGGKTVMGIDCSGFVQVIYDMCGIQLQRDASQQVEYGKMINFLSEVEPGDLAFFENSEGKIIHVGMMLNSHQIIHASGWVKIESIDSQGIISNETGEYSHKLRVVKRMI
ncbi:MAG: C40 family peptidase [Paludibacter sp.]